MKLVQPGKLQRGAAYGVSFVANINRIDNPEIIVQNYGAERNRS
jgi:hypothetical protein